MFKLNVCRSLNFQKLEKCKFLIFNMNNEPSYNTRSASSRNAKPSNIKSKKNEKNKIDLSVFKIQNKPKIKQNKTDKEDIKESVEDINIKVEGNVPGENVSEKIKGQVPQVKGKQKIEKSDIGHPLDKVKNEDTEKHMIKRKHIKIEYDEAVENVPEKNKSTLSQKKGKREMKKSDINNSLDIVKNENTEKHIKVEYDEVSPTKRKNEDNDSPKKYIKTEIKAPLNWDVVLENLREMRKSFDAPVDSMGCHKSCDESAPPKVNIF